MRSEDLDRAVGATPQAFAERMNRTLHDLKEEKEMKRFALRTAVLVVLAMLLLGTTAFAIVSQGLDWYYDHRFTAYKELQPEKYEAIKNHLTTDVDQRVCQDGDVNISVTEMSWAEEAGILVIGLTAETVDPDTYELHPFYNLDADGAYVGKDGSIDPSEDGEDRAVHWLWTEKGFGPVEEMIAPGKTLLLLKCDSVMLENDNGNLVNSWDEYVDENGSVHIVMEIYMDDEKLARLKAEDTDGDGTVTLYVTYRVVPYTENDNELYIGGSYGTMHFQLPPNASEKNETEKVDADPKALHEGDEGDSVKALQERLMTLGYLQEANGCYDEETTAAVKAFQQKNGLTADGVAGEMTQERLFSDEAIGNQ